MPIRFSCPVCKAAYTVNDRDAGKKSECAGCGQRLQVPSPPARLKTVLGQLDDDPTAAPPRQVTQPPEPKPAPPPPIPEPEPEAEPEPEYESAPEPVRRYSSAEDDPPRRRGLSAGHIGVILFSVAALIFSAVLVVVLVKRADQNEAENRRIAAQANGVKAVKGAKAEPVERVERPAERANNNAQSTNDGPDPLGILFVIAMWLAGFVVYFIPTIIAVARGHNNALGVFMLNLLLGWTCLGWTAAAVWAVINAPLIGVRGSPREAA